MAQEHSLLICSLSKGINEIRARRALKFAVEQLVRLRHQRLVWAFHGSQQSHGLVEPVPGLCPGKRVPSPSRGLSMNRAYPRLSLKFTPRTFRVISELREGDQRARPSAAALSRQTNSPELHHEAQLVHDVPVLYALTAGDAHDVDDVALDSLARRRDAHEVTLVGSL
jgi:hypothetical protein